MSVSAADRLEAPSRALDGVSPLRVLTRLRGLLPLVLALIVWQLVGDPSSTTFPPPDTWFRAIGDMASSGDLWPALRQTVLTFVLGLLIATVLGAALGMLIGASQRVDRLLDPLLEVTRSLPPPAIIPVATLVLGVTLRTSVVIVVIAVIWPILLNTAAGTRSIPAVRSEMGRSLGLRRLQIIRKVMIPSVVPSIIIGFRVAVALALIVTLAVDIIGGGQGAGLLILQRQAVFDAASVWGLLMIVGVFGFLVSLGVAALERRVMRNWGRQV